MQPDGKVLIGGYFNTVNGTNRYHCPAQCQRQSGQQFQSRHGQLPPGVFSVALQSDGKVLIGGNFYTVNGTNRNGIARLNANGSLDGSFNPGTGRMAMGLLSSPLQPDGKVLVGGGFTTFDGTNRNGIARLNANGSLDSSFNPGTGSRRLMFRSVVVCSRMARCSSAAISPL